MPGMDSQSESRANNEPVDAGVTEATESPHAEPDALSHDTSYSPGSETETQQKQEDGLPDRVADDVDADRVNVAPGTGGPDDVGDVDVDPGEINLPGGA